MQNNCLAVKILFLDKIFLAFVKKSLKLKTEQTMDLPPNYFPGTYWPA